MSTFGTCRQSGESLLTVTWLAIWGMYCPECAARVEVALKNLPGVVEAEVDWRWMGGRVVHIPHESLVDELVDCVNGVDSRAGYRFWAAAGPEVAEVLQQTWQLRSQ